MKTSNHSPILLFVLSIMLLVVYSCGSKKIATENVTRKSPLNTKAEVGKEKVIEIPCSNYRTDKSYYRATGNAKSSTLSFSRDKALLDAQQRLSRSINTQIKSVMEAFANESETESKSEFQAKTEQITRTITSESLKDVTVVCETPTKTKTEAGKVVYNTYVAIEMSVDALLKNADGQLSDSKKLEIDYDREKFRQVFNQEFDKMEQEKREYVKP